VLGILAGNRGPTATKAAQVAKKTSPPSKSSPKSITVEKHKPEVKDAVSTPPVEPPKASSGENPEDKKSVEEKAPDEEKS
jgi:hypothetical protein